jgi:hypothetical protein
MANKPAFAATPRIGAALISVANANRDGTGTVVSVFAAGAGGSRIDRIVAIGLGATTAGMVRLFIHDGAAMHFYREIVVTAVVPSCSEQAFADELPHAGDPPLDIELPTGWSLRAATQNGESISVLVFGGDF